MKTPFNSHNIATFDISIYEGLKSVLGDDLQEIINDFLDVSEELASKIIECATNGRHDDLKASAHTLKSNSAQIGALRLSELCKRMEVESGSYKHDELRALAEHIQQELKNVVNELKRI